VKRKKFEKLVEQAIERPPKAFRQKLNNVAILVEDAQPRASGRRGLLLGLFDGVPLTKKSTFSATPPDRVILYQKNIEALGSTDAEIRREVRDTLLHELGHYFGLDEDDLGDV
jgi:predicted Zn-dependent protease with MMP-like domain